MSTSRAKQRDSLPHLSAGSQTRTSRIRAEQVGGATVLAAASAAAGQRPSLRLWIPRMRRPFDSLCEGRLSGGCCFGVGEASRHPYTLLPLLDQRAYLSVSEKNPYTNPPLDPASWAPTKSLAMEWLVIITVVEPTPCFCVILLVGLWVFRLIGQEGRDREKKSRLVDVFGWSGQEGRARERGESRRRRQPCWCLRQTRTHQDDGEGVDEDGPLGGEELEANARHQDHHAACVCFKKGA